VVYDASGTPINNLIDGANFRVVVVDANRVLLSDPNTGQIISLDPQTLSGTHTITEMGQPAKTISAIDSAQIKRDGESFFVDALQSLSVSTGGSFNMLNTGDSINYFVSGGTAITGLTHNNNYEIVIDDSNSVRFRVPATNVIIDLDSQTLTGTHTFSHNFGGMIGVENFSINGFVSRRIRLSRESGGAPVSLGTRVNGVSLTATHTLVQESIHFTSPGDGSQRLIIDVISNAGGTHTLDGVGGAQALTGSPPGNDVITATSTGSGGGAVSVLNAESDTTVRPEVATTVNSGELRGNDVVITSLSHANTISLTDGSGGGLIAVGEVDSEARVANEALTTINSGAQIIASNDVTVRAETIQIVDIESEAGAAGLGAGVDANGKAWIDFTADVTINGTISAQNSILAESESSLDSDNETDARAGGFGADADANRSSNEGTFVGNSDGTAGGNNQNGRTDTRTVIGETLIGRTVNLNALVTKMNVDVDADSRASAAGGVSKARANIDATDRIEVALNAGSSIVADNVNIAARNTGVDMDAISNATLNAAGGRVDADSDIDYTSTTVVTGANNALISVINMLDVVTQQFNPNSSSDIRRNPDVDKNGPFIGGNSDNNGTATANRDIVWNATVELGGVSPVLEINASGGIVEAVGLSVSETATTITVNDIVNQVANARFDAESITGSTGNYIIKPTLDNVTITNQSDKSLIINNISVANKTDQAFVNFVNDQDGIQFDIDFDTANPTTLITINNLSTSPTSNVTLNGVIDNPIGTTNITNTGGSILDANGGLIRSNIIDLDATNGSIGVSATPVDIELMETNGRPESLTANAGTDIFIDLTGISLGGNTTVNVPSLTAGNDVNVTMQPFLNATANSGNQGLGLDVQHNGTSQGIFQSHFQPDVVTNPTIDCGPFDFSTTAAAGTFDFGIITAGNDIDLNANNNGGPAVNVNANTNLTGMGNIDIFTSEGNIDVTETTGDMRLGLIQTDNGDVNVTSTNGSIVDALNDAAADVVGNNVTLSAPNGSIGADGNPIEVDSMTLVGTGMGDVHVTETVGDLNLGQLISTGGSVFASAPNGGIVDVDDTNGADIQGDGAFLTAGNGDIGSTGNSIDTSVNSFEANATGGVFIDNDKGLAIGGVDAGNTGINSGGEVNVSAAGQVDINENVVGNTNVTITAIDTAATGEDLNVAMNVNVTSTTGNVDLRAGDNLTVGVGSTISAPMGTVVLQGDFGNADTFGTTITIDGVLDALISATARGNDDDDTIILRNNSHTTSIIFEGGMGTDSGTVQNTNITSAPTDGLLTKDVETIDISGSTMNSNGRDGIQLNRSTSVMITGTTANMNTRDGIRIDGANGDVSITGTSNFNQNTEDGVHILNSTIGTFTFSDSFADMNAQNGLIVDPSALTTVNITNGSFDNNTAGDGIDIETSSAATFTFDTVTADSNGADGITLDGTASTFSITGGSASNNSGNGFTSDGSFGATNSNFDTNTGGAGISITNADSATFTFDSVSIDSNTGDGININGSVTSFTAGNGSTFDMNSQDGIDISGTTAAFSITGGSASNNTSGSGIIVDDLTGTFSANGTLVNMNGTDGIQLSGDGATSSDIDITNVTGDNNGRNGVRVVNIPGTLDIVDSNFRTNTGDGIFVMADVVTTIDDGTHSGIMIRNADSVTVQGTGTVISTSVVDIESDNGFTLATDLDAQGNTIRVAANGDSAGSEGLLMQSGTSMTTTNDTPTAIVLTVNTLMGGTGNATIEELFAGTTSGPAGGRITVSANMGAIVDGNGAANNLTAGNAILQALGGVGTSADPIETTISRIEGTGGTGGFFLTNNGALSIGGIDPAFVGVTTTGNGDIVIIANSPLNVEENVIGGGNVTLSAGETTSLGDSLTVNAGVIVRSNTGNVSLSAGDDITAQLTSVIEATAGAINITSDVNDQNPGVGTTITIAAQLIAANGTTITGGTDDDNYNLTYPTGATNSGVTTIVDASGTDSVVINGGSTADVLFVTTDDTTTTDQFDHVSRGTINDEIFRVPCNVESLTVNGGDGNDSITAQPSMCFPLIIEGGNPQFGDPGVPPGDTFVLDPLGNTFNQTGNQIQVDNGTPNPFELITINGIERETIEPISTVTPQRYDFNQTTGAGTTQSPTEPGFTGVTGSTIFNPAGGQNFGWDIAMSEYRSRFNMGAQQDLVNDGHSFYPSGSSQTRTFSSVVDNGFVLVTVSFGNVGVDMTGLQIEDADTGQILATGLSTAALETGHVSFPIQVTDGTLNLRFRNTTTGFRGRVIPISSIDIRPAVLSSMGINVPAAPLTADGTTVDTSTIFGAPPNALVTVETTRGTITTADADPFIQGIQVLSDANGMAQLMIRRPTAAGTAVVNLTSVVGFATGSDAINYGFPLFRNFDFNTNLSATFSPFEATTNPDGYLGVKGSDLFTPELGYGWLDEPNNSILIPSVGGTDATLRDDFQRNTRIGTFRQIVDNGVYQISVLQGDVADHDNLRITANGTPIDVDSVMSRNFVQTIFEVTVNNGQLDLIFEQTESLFGASNWVLNALSIRSATAISAVTTAGNIGTVEADDMQSDTLNFATSATDGTLFTVSTTLGTISTVDADSTLNGIQVAASGGSISINVTRPDIAGVPTFELHSIEGAHRGTITDGAFITYDVAAVRRFDFSNGTSDATASPIQAGFRPVFHTDRSHTTMGYGLTDAFLVGFNQPGEIAPVTNDDLYRDGMLLQNDGLLETTVNFLAEVKSGTSYDVRVYLGHPVRDFNGVVVSTEGAAGQNADTAEGAFTTVTFFGVTDVNNDGFLSITVEDTGGDNRGFAINGIDIAESATGLPASLTLLAADQILTANTSETGYVDAGEPLQLDESSIVETPDSAATEATEEQLQEALESAIAAWTATGLTADELTRLREVRASIESLDPGVLGQAGSRYIEIDDDAAGSGWSTDSDVDPNEFDLFTVVAHELGHILGRPDDYVGEGVMSSHLETGVRKTIENEIDDVFAQPNDFFDL
jgi:hypothetical protein